MAGFRVITASLCVSLLVISAASLASAAEVQTANASSLLALIDKLIASSPVNATVVERTMQITLREDGNGSYLASTVSALGVDFAKVEFRPYVGFKEPGGLLILKIASGCVHPADAHRHFDWPYSRQRPFQILYPEETVADAPQPFVLALDPDWGKVTFGFSDWSESSCLRRVIFNVHDPRVESREK